MTSLPAVRNRTGGGDSGDVAVSGSVQPVAVICRRDRLLLSCHHGTASGPIALRGCDGYERTRRRGGDAVAILRVPSIHRRPFRRASGQGAAGLRSSVGYGGAMCRYRATYEGRADLQPSQPDRCSAFVCGIRRPADGFACPSPRREHRRRHARRHQMPFWTRWRSRARMNEAPRIRCALPTRAPPHRNGRT